MADSAERSVGLPSVTRVPYTRPWSEGPKAGTEMLTLRCTLYWASIVTNSFIRKLSVSLHIRGKISLDVGLLLSVKRSALSTSSVTVRNSSASSKEAG